MKSQRFEIIISELDFYLINRIKELRETSQPYVSQNKLSRELGLADGFISKVENFKERSKYNIWTVNKVGRILGLKSFNEILPENFFDNDIVKIQLEILKDDSRQTSYKIVSKKPLNETEMEHWKRGKLDYCTPI